MKKDLKMASFRLTQFEELLSAVKKFNIADFSQKTEKARFEEGEGLDRKPDLSDVFETDSKELFIIQRNGAIRKAVIHIVDISGYRLEWGHPKFHVYCCQKIEEMRQNKRRHRLKASSRADGRFYLIKKSQKGYEPLDICGHCLNLYNKEFKTSHTKKSFPLKSYLERKMRGKTKTAFQDFSLDHGAIPSRYAKSWQKISNYVRQQAKYICSSCFGDFSANKCRRFLHTHHADGDKRNNLPENLKALCIKCHSEEHNHGHIKSLPEYKEYLESGCPK